MINQPAQEPMQHAQVAQDYQRMNDYLDKSIIELRQQIIESNQKNRDALEVIMKMLKDNKESIKSLQERRSK